MSKVFLPDGQQVEFPATGLSVEEVRDVLSTMGFPVEGAQIGEDENGDYIVSRPVGGKKG